MANMASPVLRWNRVFEVLALGCICLFGCKTDQNATSDLRVYRGQKADQPWILPIAAAEREKAHKGTVSLMCPNVALTAGHVFEKGQLGVILPTAPLAKAIGENILKLDGYFAVVKDASTLPIKGNKKYIEGPESVALLQVVTNFDYTPENRRRLNQMAFGRIGNLAAWKKPMDLERLRIFGFGDVAIGKAIDTYPHGGHMRINRFVGAHWLAPVNKNDSSAVISLGLVLDGPWTDGGDNRLLRFRMVQHARPGDSGGPLTINFFSKYIFGILTEGSKLEKKTVDEIAKLLEANKFPVKQKNRIKQLHITSAMAVASPPVRQWIIAELKRLCDPQWLKTDAAAWLNKG